jgi:hypothetical protein
VVVVVVGCGVVDVSWEPGIRTKRFIGGFVRVSVSKKCELSGWGF